MHENLKIEELMKDIKLFIATSYELNKLEAIERSSVLGAGLIKNIIIALMGILVIFFLSFGAGMYLSRIIGDDYSGFIILSAVFLLLGFLILKKGRVLIEKPVKDKIIKKSLENLIP